MYTLDLSVAHKLIKIFKIFASNLIENSNKINKRVQNVDLNKRKLHEDGVVQNRVRVDRDQVGRSSPTECVTDLEQK
jgi:hypothetical protein